jgi:hypothetical protein
MRGHFIAALNRRPNTAVVLTRRERLCSINLIAAARGTPPR